MDDVDSMSACVYLLRFSVGVIRQLDDGRTRLRYSLALLC